MPLTVTITSYRGSPPMDRVATVFTAQGGTLGRAPDNDLVLPDPEKVISRAHASISYRNGAFYLTDTSLAGTVIANRGITLHQSSPQESVRLENGDILKVGDYELSVTISEMLSPAPPSPPSGFMPEPYPAGPLPGAGSGQGDLDLERLLSSGKGPEPEAYGQVGYLPPEPPDTGGLLHAPPQQESFTPPQMAPLPREEGLPSSFNPQDLLSSLEEPEEVEEPGDFPYIPPPPPEAPPAPPARTMAPEPQKTPPQPFPAEPVPEAPQPEPASMPPPPPLTPTAAPIPEPAPAVPQPPPAQTAVFTPQPVPATQPVPTASPQASTDQGRQQSMNELAALFLEAAGIGGKPSLQPEEVAELMQVAGTLVKEMTGGLMTMLRGRMEMKNQFRVSRTVLRTTGNNPLKFSLTAEDALQLLLVEKKPGFLPAIEAVQQGCRDLMHHELAATAANQAALIALLKLFDPTNFSQQFEEGFVLQKKSKCWDKYCLSYQELTKAAQENFYGEDFARAYEEQMAKLKAGGRG